MAKVVKACDKPIAGIIHGAGVLADRAIVDQTAEQFDLVYAPRLRASKTQAPAIRKT